MSLSPSDSDGAGVSGPLIAAPHPRLVSGRNRTNRHPGRYWPRARDAPRQSLDLTAAGATEERFAFPAALRAPLAPANPAGWIATNATEFPRRSTRAQSSGPRRQTLSDDTDGAWCGVAASVGGPRVAKRVDKRRTPDGWRARLGEQRELTFCPVRGCETLATIAREPLVAQSRSRPDEVPKGRDSPTRIGTATPRGAAHYYPAYWARSVAADGQRSSQAHWQSGTIGANGVATGKRTEIIQSLLARWCEPLMARTNYQPAVRAAGQWSIGAPEWLDCYGIAAPVLGE